MSTAKIKMAPNKTAGQVKVSLVQEVREFILGNSKPVTFSQVFQHLSRDVSAGKFRPVDVKLATYQVIHDGDAKITENWTIKGQKQKGAVRARLKNG